MKKVLFIAVAVAAVSFSSCKKEYDCNCVDNFTGAESTKTGEGSSATDACDDAESKILTIPQEDCSPA